MNAIDDETRKQRIVRQNATDVFRVPPVKAVKISVPDVRAKGRASANCPVYVTSI
jgi:hypothetical protein